MYISLFWLAILGLVYLYFRHKRQQQLKTILAVYDAAQKAGITASDADTYTDHFAFWMNEIPTNTPSGDFVNRLYDNYRLPRDRYAYINEQLVGAIKRQLRVEQYDLVKHKKRTEANLE